MKPGDKKRCKFWNDLKSGKFAELVSEASAGEALSNSNEVYSILKPLFAAEDDVEKVYCIFLNSKNRILAIELMASGSINSSAVYPREVIKKVLALKASAIVMAHNHPSGDPEPSHEDLDLTKSVSIGMKAIGTVVHEHLIIGNGGRYYSMADYGIIERFRNDINQLFRC